MNRDSIIEHCLLMIDRYKADLKIITNDKVMYGKLYYILFDTVINLIKLDNGYANCEAHECQRTLNKYARKIHICKVDINEAGYTIDLFNRIINIVANDEYSDDDIIKIANEMLQSSTKKKDEYKDSSDRYLTLINETATFQLKSINVGWDENSYLLVCYHKNAYYKNLLTFESNKKCNEQKITLLKFIINMMEVKDAVQLD